MFCKNGKLFLLRMAVERLSELWNGCRQQAQRAIWESFLESCNKKRPEKKGKIVKNSRSCVFDQKSVNCK